MHTPPNPCDTRRRSSDAPLVLLHGFAHTSQQWEPMLRLTPALHQGKGLCLPLPFHEAPPVASFDDAVADSLARLGAVHTEAVHLAGYSLGARLALAMALQAPQRFARLTLLSGHIGLETPTERTARARADARWQHLLRTRGTEAFLHSFRQQALFASTSAADSPWAQCLYRARCALDAHALADSLSVMGLATMPNYWPQLASLRVPVTFVAGGRDTKFLTLLRRAEALVRAPSRLLVVDGAFHDVLADAPAAVADVLAGDLHSWPL